MDVPFTPSSRRSVGVEWELQIVDRETRELVPAAPELIEELRGHDGQPHPKVKPELLQCEIELITGICDTIAEVRTDGRSRNVRCPAHEDARAGPDG
jgi:glutamate---cysteine ligase / carboxylate-amine ligase